MSTVLDENTRKEMISENLQRIVAERGLSQRALARETNYAVMTINDALHGRRMPSAGLIANLAEALDVSADEILGTPRKKSRKSA